MHVYHNQYGWGNVLNHDFKERKALIDFTDYPYEAEEKRKLSMDSLQDARMRFETMLAERGRNKNEYAVVPILVYRDRMNDGEYIAYEEVVCVPREIADTVHVAKVSFQMDSITFYDILGNELLHTLSTCYEDLEEVKAFIM